MPAEFHVPRSNNFASRGMLPTIYGKQFPSDEIQALWHMIPGDFWVEFSAGTHEFVIKDLSRIAPGRTRFESPVGVRCIPAKACFDYERWVEVFQDLCAEAAAAILSAQNIDHGSA